MDAVVAPTTYEPVRPSAAWTGRILSGLGAALLGLDAVVKLLLLPAAVAGSARVGFDAHAVFAIGVVEALCIAAYLVPRTAVFGAILLTGYFGGAVATHVRLGDPLLSHVLAPVYVATLFWLGLWLRDPRLRALVPLRARR